MLKIETDIHCYVAINAGWGPGCPVFLVAEVGRAEWEEGVQEAQVATGCLCPGYHCLHFPNSIPKKFTPGKADLTGAHPCQLIRAASHQWRHYYNMQGQRQRPPTMGQCLKGGVGQ